MRETRDTQTSESYRESDYQVRETRDTQTSESYRETDYQVRHRIRRDRERRQTRDLVSLHQGLVSLSDGSSSFVVQAAEQREGLLKETPG